MRLLKLNGNGGFILETFRTTIPSYAILSHTWGSDSDEVTFKDVVDGVGKNKAGYQKLVFCGGQAKSDGLSYFWVDTCCIDKSNPNELTKAINSMFRWYQNAVRCYVYLSDVSVRTQDGQTTHIEWESSLRNSRWFTRGWTLQELLAPRVVEFYSRDHVRLGDRRSLERHICEKTGIAIEALQGRPLHDFSVEERFRWVENRQTTEEEDMAYCLLGIFGIFLPLIYGEGRENAIRRLNREIDVSGHQRDIPGNKQQLRLTQTDYKNQKFVNDIRTSGTCEWFLQLEKYIKWAESDQSQVLWVTADPGCGKSVLCSFLIDTLQQQAFSLTNHTTLCFFFFKNGHDGLQTGTDLLCAILEQLFLSNPILAKHLPSDAFEDGKFQLAHDFACLWSVLTNAVQDPQAARTTFVVDALDECETNSRLRLVRSLAKLFTDTQSSQRGSSVFKFLITSRPDVTIEDGFHGCKTIQLKVEDNIDLTNADISLVIKDRVAKLQRRVGWPLDTLEKMLLGKADQTFLWAGLVLELLEKERDVSSDTFENLATTLPIEIDDLYDKILNNLAMDQVNRTKLTKLLHIVVAARRPLTLAEANIAFRIRKDDTNLAHLTDRLRQSNIQETLKRLCGPFIRIIQGKVHLVHLTAREFLTAQEPVRITQQPPLSIWKHSLDPVISNLVMAGCCISYLKFKEIQSLPPPNFSGMYNGNRKEMISRFTQPYDFLEYAAEHWPAHYRECEAYEDVDILLDAVAVCNTQLQSHRIWFPLFWAIHEGLGDCELGLTPWSLASYLGHLSTLQYFQRRYPESFDVNERDTHGRTPLYFAVERGNAEVVQFLIDNGADIALNIDYSQETVLHTAANEGNTKILKIILGTGIDPDIPAENGGYTALESAAGGGHAEAVRLLLSDGADGTDFEVLWAAVLSGSEECLHAVLPWAEINGFGHEKWTALHWACSKDYGVEKMARVLLENGADPNAQHSCHPGTRCCHSQTPLHLAIDIGSVALCELLLAHGADATRKDKQGQTPLDHAKSIRNDELVRIMTQSAQRRQVRQAWF